MSDIKISIVIPIYNAEQYLYKCIESVIQQTYQNLEIILVDDGSKDSSGAICDSYAKKDSRIKVIHKKNAGVAAARNTALTITTGEYIGFVDSDDYIDPDMFETLLNLSLSHQKDIAMIGHRNIEDNKIINASTFTGETMIYSKLDAMKQILLDNKVQNYLWDKLFKKSLFQHISFPDRRTFEDMGTTLRLFEQSNGIVFYDVPKYNYVKHSNSIVASYTYSNCKNFFDTCIDNYHYLDGKYPEVDLYNAYSFVSNMLIIYKNSLVYDLDLLYQDFCTKTDIVIKLMKQYQKDIIPLFQDYILVIYSLFIWNKEKAKPILKLFEEERLNTIL